MAKEIERKWLWDYEKFPNFGKYIENLYLPYFNIKDYYFNDYCRLRDIEGSWFLTIKSKGSLVRDEYEFEIDNEQITFLPTPVLCKDRILYVYEGYMFEINVFRDIFLPNKQNLVIVELELTSPSPKNYSIPEICGEEITKDKQFYGYNLFKKIKASQTIQGPYKDNIVFLLPN